jgi:2-methylisocitrate lyase-like PEP mutase family enzyme
MDEIRRAAFRRLVGERRAVLMPGAANALAGRIVEDLGFECLYLTGAGVTNTHLGLPDLAFVGLGEIGDHVLALREATDLPLLVDADTGFGNAVNVHHTVRRLERAGADAIQLEDQVMPKRCGHFAGKQVVAAEEMVGKIKAAVDARRSDDLMVVARTDAAAVEGFSAAVDRANRYAEAGADVLFVEAPESTEHVTRLPSLVAAPLLVNVVVGGRTPVLDQAELARLGYALVLYANTALQAAVRGMQEALGQLKATGRMDEDVSLVASFAERQRLVRKPLFDALERRYAAED